MQAMSDLNEWRALNPLVRIINIESVTLLPTVPDPESKLIEPHFDLLRVWYED